MIKFTNISNTHIGRRSKKADKEKWYIYKTEYLLAAAFYKSAGGVGRIILDYILWKRSMNGSEWITLPNTHFKLEFGIERQKGKATLIKLSVRN